MKILMIQKSTKICTGVVDEPVKPSSEQIQRAIEKRFGQTGLSLENLEVSVDAKSKVIIVTRKRK